MKRILFVLALAMMSAGGFAGHHEKDEQAAEPGAAAMSEEAMMAAMAAAATPGEPHAKMIEMVGEYSAEMTFLMDPSGEPQSTTMQVERTLDLGGRVLVETWSGEFMDMPFNGHSRIGYDNVTGRYWSTWTDNWSTGVIVMYGDWDEEKQQMVLEGTNAHPVTGLPYKMRSVSRDLEPGKSVMDMYEDYGDGMVQAFSVTMTKL